MGKLKWTFMLNPVKELVILGYFITFSNILLGQFSVKVLDENFNSNSRRWDIKSDSSSEMTIVAGKYILKNKIDGVALSSTIEAPHLQLENFRITAKLSIKKGNDNTGFGIIWGATDVNNDFEFVITANGFYKILKWENGNRKDIIPWTYQSSINKWESAVNELKIECNPEITRFYINGNYVAVTKYEKPFGQNIGFVLNETMEVSIDELVAENLTGPVKTNPENQTMAIQISKVELSGVESYNVLKVGEKALLNVELTNTSENACNDLILSVITQDAANGLWYNQLSMIDKIEKNGSKQISIPVEADETVSEQNINMKIELSTINKKIIDTDNIFFDIKKPVITANSSEETNNSDPGGYNSGSGSSNEMDSCTNTCISTGLATLITAIIVAIFE